MTSLSLPELAHLTIHTVINVEVCSPVSTDYIAIPAETETVAQRIENGKKTALTELQRGDSKAAHLLGFFGAVLAGVLTLTRTGMSPAGLVLLYLAAAPTAAAVVLLLWTLRPNLSGGGHAGFTRWAMFTATPAQLVSDLERTERHDLEDQAHHLAVLSALAVAKYRRITTAVGLLLIGLTVTALALIAA